MILHYDNDGEWVPYIPHQEPRRIVSEGRDPADGRFYNVMAVFHNPVEFQLFTVEEYKE